MSDVAWASILKPSMSKRTLAIRYLMAVLGAYGLLNLIGVVSWLFPHSLYLRWSGLVVGFLLAALWFGCIAPAHKRLWLIAAVLFAPVPLGVYLLVQPLVWQAAERAVRYQVRVGSVPPAIQRTLQETVWMTMSAAGAYVGSVAVVWGLAAWRRRGQKSETQG